VKRLTFVLAAVVAISAAACSNNGAPSVPPPPIGNFSNSSLKGTYAFSMSGQDGGLNFGAFIARVGSFTADGSGGITAAIEDVTDAGSLPQLVVFTSGRLRAHDSARVLAPNAEEGLALAPQVRPNLILLDHQLPGTTGYHLCRELIQLPEIKETPFVVTSTLRKRAYAEYTDIPNVVDSLPKPFTPEQLLTTVAAASFAEEVRALFETL